MPPRVVTADLESMLGIPILAVVAVPYDPEQTVPPPFSGGAFLDVLCMLPAGTQDAGAIDPHAYEAVNNAPGRLKKANAGPLHEIWGWPHRLDELDPNNEDDALVIARPRIQSILYDLGDKLNWRLTNARPISRGDGRVVVETLVDSPGNSANRPLQYIYDTLDAHPPGLRAVIERSPWVRRETERDPPPGWNERKPDVP
jgi:hypothetical protein